MIKKTVKVNLDSLVMFKPTAFGKKVLGILPNDYNLTGNRTVTARLRIAIQFLALQHYTKGF
jgi:hypothetical protein